jgi:hypothetical protein
MRCLLINITFLGCAWGPSPETRIDRARAQCQTYYERAVCWVKANDVPEWPEDQGGYWSLYWSDTVHEAIQEMLSDLPPPEDPWGQKLRVIIHNQTGVTSWLASLHIVSPGPDCRFDDPISPSDDDIFHPPLEALGTRLPGLRHPIKAE